MAGDRSPEHRAAITETLPEAAQVVDCWHLVKNLQEALDRSLEVLHISLRDSQSPQLAREYGHPLRTELVRAGTEQKQCQSRRQQRIKRYQAIQECKAQGMSMRRIGRLLGPSRGTVRTFYRADTYPEMNHRTTTASIFDLFMPYLEQWVQDGCTNAQHLWREIVE